MPYDDEDDILQRRKRVLGLNSDAQLIQDQLNSQYPNGVPFQPPIQQPIQQPQVQAPPDIAPDAARPPLQFNVAPVDTPPPPPPGPSPFQQMLSREPMQRDYHPSTGRKILGGIAGVASGILSGSPEYGMRVGHDINYQPYTREHSNWEQQLQNLYTGEKEQGEVDKNRATIEHLKSQSEAEVARKGAEEERRKGEAYKSSKEYQDFQLRLKDATKKPGTPYNIKLKDGKTIFAAQSRAEGGFLDPKNQTLIDNDAIASIEPSTEKGVSSNLALLRQAFKQQNGRDPTPQELETMNQGLKPPVDPAVEKGRDLKNKLTEAQINKLTQETSSEGMDNLADMVHQNPDLIDRVPSKNVVSFAQAYKKKFDEPIPAKLDAAIRTQRAKSRITVQHAEAIRQMVQDPKMKQYLGPIMGRFGDIEQYAGGEIRGIPPELQAEAQDLRTRLKYLLVQEASSLAGNRPAIQLIRELKKSSPDTRMTMPFLLGALDGVEGSNKTQLQAIDKLQRGEPVEKQSRIKIISVK